MPVDSIMTSVMVTIRIGSKIGRAISKGSTRSNQLALATFSKPIMPAAVAMTPPMTMPSSTEMLATKPRAYLAISRMETSTMAAMPMCDNCAYLGLGTEPTMAMPWGTGDTLPLAAACLAASSQARCSGLGTEGAVGPKGLPKIQLMPILIRLIPMTAMMVPVTTGGKKRSMRLTSGAMSIEITPAPMMEPKIRPAPSVPGWLLAMATMGATEAKVTPIMTGNLMPNHWVAPSDWIRVTMPQQNRSAEISMATCSGLSLSARPTMSGTATAPAYITSTCCRPSAASLPWGRRSSTG